MKRMKGIHRMLGYWGKRSVLQKMLLMNLNLKQLLQKRGWKHWFPRQR